MTSGADNSILACPVDLRREALRLLLRDNPPDARQQQIEELIGAEGKGLAGLLVSQAGKRIDGVVLARELAGRAAFVWPPRLADDATDELAIALIGHALAWLAGRGVTLAQALPAQQDLGDHERLARAGFQHLSDLLYLLCPDTSLPRELPTSVLRFESYDDANDARLRSVIERTYEGSLDCPELDGLREMNDVLAGYRATGVYSPERWLIATRDGRDVGCLLLADDPALGHVELVYMGIVPEARGRGLGLQLVRHGQWLTGAAGRPRMVVSVDAANAPAIDMYTAAGFTVWDKRPVYIKLLR